MPRLSRFHSRLLVLALLCAISSAAHASDVVLDFKDVAIPGGTNSAPFFVYDAKGFSLTAVNPPSGFLTGFVVNGPKSSSWAGAIGVVASAPAGPPSNFIQLVPDDNQPFAVLSIDLARDVLSDPAPTVTFTGVRPDLTTVTESFTVSTPSGVRAFQTFAFTGFSNLISLNWEQPDPAEGMHQFSNIHLQTVPEPSVLSFAVAAVLILALRFEIPFARRPRMLRL